MRASDAWLGARRPRRQVDAIALAGREMSRVAEARRKTPAESAERSLQPPAQGCLHGGGRVSNAEEGPLEHHLFVQTEDGRRERAKISDIMLEFAQPLLGFESGGPRDMNELRKALQLATLCWNAPLYAARGDHTFMRAIDDVLALIPGDLSARIRAMMADRQGRFAAVPFAVIADAAGTTVAEARITASAYLPGEPAPRRSGAPALDELPKASLPGGMMPLDTLFRDLAREEACTVRAALAGSDEAVEYVAREFYCTEPRCDCRRVILHFVDPRRRRVVASINYAFDPSRPPFEDERQISLDPLNPQSEQSDLVLRAFEGMLAAEPDQRERFLRHYRLWKSVVDDPRHADHRKVRSVYHDDPSFRPAFPGESFRRATPKVGANEPCPCGSGRKYKKCCRT
jgi:hypothetical protein